MFRFSKGNHFFLLILIPHVLVYLFMHTVELNNAVWKEGNYYVAQNLNVEVSSFGDTKEEALLNLQEALELYFEDNQHPDVAVVEHPEIVTSTLKYA